ncbi:MAG TPA: hypothetical protein VMF11_00940 [Candidatus Baltobacteraceae bacterium]|nr:hypothetical protein [Candidatus Baltobacteraceae bacterium]
MSTGTDDATPAQDRRGAPWYWNPIWLLPVVIIALSLWLAHVFSEKPAPPIVNAPVNLATTGSNLLENPSFSQGMQGWVEYHNAQPMQVTISKGSGRVDIRIDGAKNSVQEVYQFLGAPPAGSLIATGRIRISGAPLPGDTSAGIMFVDSSGRGTMGFSAWRKNGLGTFPFAFAYKPNGVARQFVLAVIVGKVSNNKTVVSFDDLKVAKAKD